MPGSARARYHPAQVVATIEGRLRRTPIAGRSAAGLTTSRPVFLTQDSPGVPDQVEFGDNFGLSLLASDVNRDGRADLTAVAGQENDPEGAVSFLPGASSTLYSTTASTTFGPTRVGLPTRTYTAFGTHLAG